MSKPELTQRENIKIVSYPGRGDVNPYVGLFYDALAPYDIELVGNLKFEKKWFSENLNRFDAIHLHFPELVWRNYSNPKLKKLADFGIRGTWRMSKIIETTFSDRLKKEGLVWFESVLKYLKSYKKKIIWTWHNIEPHENVDGYDHEGHQILSDYSDLIIFHSKTAEKQSRELYRLETDTVIMPHGNYDGVYPMPRDKALVIDELSLDPYVPIVGCLGALRDYKGLDVVCDACSLLGKSIQFLCAGNPHHTFDFEQLQTRIANINNSTLIPRFITDQEFSDYVSLCDIVLLPYKHITGSGALLAALTLGRGVIASDLPFFREVLSQDADAGRLVPVGDHFALSQAIRDYLKVPSGVREKAAKKVASTYNWDIVVQPVANKIISISYL